jgi:hypothetical protein
MVVEAESRAFESGEKKKRTQRCVSLTGRSMKPCHVCLGLQQHSADSEDDRWQLGFKADLTAEYTLDFESSQLHTSVESGCDTCSVVSSGLELINRNLSLFDVGLYRGRFILQPQPEIPVEVEIFNDELEEKDDFPPSTRARIQFYMLPGESIDHV